MRTSINTRASLLVGYVLQMEKQLSLWSERDALMRGSCKLWAIRLGWTKSTTYRVLNWLSESPICEKYDTESGVEYFVYPYRLSDDMINHCREMYYIFGGTKDE